MRLEKMLCEKIREMDTYLIVSKKNTTGWNARGY